jgi:hypothetical protein
MKAFARAAAVKVTEEIRQEANLHAYTAEQLYACAERAALYLDTFDEAQVAAVQAFLLNSARREVEAAYAALGEAIDRGEK